MKTKASTIASILGFLLLCVNASMAQKQEPIRADWLAMDVANIERLLPQLKHSEPLTIAKLQTIFGDRFSSITDLGFGGRKFTFLKGGGYTALRVKGFAFNDTIGEYEIYLDDSDWSRIGKVLTAAWKRSSDLEFKEWKDGIYHKREIPNVVADFKIAVSSKLGELQPVTVPLQLKDAYEELVSFGKNSRIGDGGCGYGGVTPAGKKAIDALVKADRIDLIGNILKGYNPGGRMYAALALIALQGKGTQLSPDVVQTLEIVRTLDLELDTCDGCTFSTKTAKQIIADWPF